MIDANDSQLAPTDTKNQQSPREWWKAKQQHHDKQDSNTCFICQSSLTTEMAMEDDNKHDDDKSVMPRNSLHRYFAPKPSLGRTQNNGTTPSMAHQEQQSSPMTTTTTTTATTARPPSSCHYCQHQLCQNCTLTCLSCQHTFCTICCRSSDQVYGYHMGHLCFDCVPQTKPTPTAVTPPGGAQGREMMCLD